jgi:hypothetical protein
MNKNIENHVFCSFTQYLKSSPIATKLDVNQKLCKTMFANIVKKSLPNIDGRNGDLESSSSQKPCTISMNPMQLSNLWYPW